MADASIEKIASRKRRRLIALGKELDDDAQKFIKSLRKGGTPINTAVILAAVEGIMISLQKTGPFWLAMVITSSLPKAGQSH